MHIIYDHQIFSSQVYGGISRYFYELATRMANYSYINAEIIAPLYLNQYINNNPTFKVNGRHIKKYPYSATIIRVLNVALSKRPLKMNPPEIIHETYYAKKPLASGRTRTVVTVYDMIHEKYSEFFSPYDKTAEIKAFSVKRADHIICISENTKNDLVEMLNIEPERISVVHLGSSINSSPNLSDSISPVDGSYLLYVGTRAGHKNFERLLQAYASSEQLRANFKLVCFGGNSFSRQEIYAIGKLGLQHNNVTHISGSDDILSSLYSHASAFVYPSVYEGFGLSPLEAMSCHCPVICSNTGSLPEVVGNAGVYFNPVDIDDIRHTIESVVFSSDISGQLADLGMERVKIFNWDTCAEQTLTIYSNLLHGHGEA